MPTSRSSTSSPAETDDNDGLPDLTFDWNYVDGLLVPRNDKHAQRAATPPTPLDTAAVNVNDKLSLHESPFKRKSTLARSESAFPVLTGPSTDRERARLLQRTSSGQILPSPGGT
jgi:hypothetical protein